MAIHCPKPRLFFILKFRAESYDCSIRNVEGGVFFAVSGSIQVNLKSEFKKIPKQIERTNMSKPYCAKVSREGFVCKTEKNGHIHCSAV